MKSVLLNVILIGNVWICFRSDGLRWIFRERSDCYYVKLVVKFPISYRYPQTSANNELAEYAKQHMPKIICFLQQIGEKKCCTLEIKNLGLSDEINWAVCK